MELYTLSPSYSRTAMIDDFESFIWTERFSDHGDFEISLPPNSKVLPRLKPRSYVENSKSPQPMVVLTNDKQMDADGRVSILVKGKTLTHPAMVKRQIVPDEGKENWSWKGSPAGVLYNMIKDHIVVPRYGSTKDIIPNLQLSLDSSSGADIEVALPPGELYSAYKGISDDAGLGFAIEVWREDKFPLFKILESRRRYNVVFSEKLDSLTEVGHLKSIDASYNVAYVWDKDNKHRLEVFAPGVSSSISGFDRHVLTVSATDIDSEKITDAAVRTAQMQARGRAELAKYKPVNLYDATLTPYSPYSYRENYWLGDIVKLMLEDGSIELKKVTEYIWTWGPEGLVSYPTFSEYE